MESNLAQQSLLIESVIESFIALFISLITASRTQLVSIAVDKFNTHLVTRLAKRYNNENIIKHVYAFMKYLITTYSLTDNTVNKPKEYLGLADPLYAIG